MNNKLSVLQEKLFNFAGLVKERTMALREPVCNTAIRTVRACKKPVLQTGVLLLEVGVINPGQGIVELLKRDLDSCEDYAVKVFGDNKSKPT